MSDAGRELAQIMGLDYETIEAGPGYRPYRRGMDILTASPAHLIESAIRGHPPGTVPVAPERFPTDKPVRVPEKLEQLWYRREEKAPFFGGFAEAARHETARQAIGALDAERRGEIRLTAKERQQAADIMVEYTSDLNTRAWRGETVPASIAEGLADLVPYMIEFMVTHGIATAARTATSSAIRTSLRKFGTTAFRRGLTNVAAEVGGLAAGGFTRTVHPATWHRTAAGMEERRMPRRWSVLPDGSVRIDAAGDPAGTAFVKAFGDTWIEMTSEETGEYIGKGLTAVGKRIPGVPRVQAAFREAFRRTWLRMGLSAAKFDQGWLTRAGFHGIIEELGEERVGNTLRALFNTNDFGLSEEENTVLNRMAMSVPSGRELAVEAGVFAVPGAAGQVGRIGQLRRQAQAWEARREAARTDSVGPVVDANPEAAQRLVAEAVPSRTKIEDLLGFDPRWSAQERADYARRVSEYLTRPEEPGVEREVLRAEAIEAQVEGAGVPEGLVEGAAEPVRVRDVAEDRVEAGPGAVEEVRPEEAPGAEEVELPTVVYHATGRKFQGLPQEAVGAYGEKRRMLWEPDGVFYHRSKQGATYAAGLSSIEHRHVAAQVTAKNPLVVTAANRAAFEQQYNEICKDMFPGRVPDEMLPHEALAVSQEFTSRLRDQGYDAIYKTDTGDFIALTEEAVTPQAPAEEVAPPVPAVAETEAVEEPITKSVKELPTAPDPNLVYQVPTDTIAVDAARFQFKEIYRKTGAEKWVEEVEHWDPHKGGVILVWRDPAQGKTYVVNGHHRLAIARRLGIENIAVRYIDKATAREARAVGALTNIAEGRGKPVDVAKVFRDTKMTPAALKHEGVSLHESLVKDGLALANLEPGLFMQVVREELPVQRAIIIGRDLPNHEHQYALLQLLKKRRLADLNNAQLEGLIAEIAGTAEARTAAGETGDLFAAIAGTERDVRRLESRAKLRAAIKGRLTYEVNTFRQLAQERRAALIQEAGIAAVDVEKARTLTVDTQQLLDLFDRLVGYKGPLSIELNRAADRLLSGVREATVQEELYGTVRQAIERELGQKDITRVREVGEGRGGEAAAGPVELGGEVAPAPALALAPEVARQEVAPAAPAPAPEVKPPAEARKRPARKKKLSPAEEQILHAEIEDHFQEQQERYGGAIRDDFVQRMRGGGEALIPAIGAVGPQLPGPESAGAVMPLALRQHDIVELLVEINEGNYPKVMDHLRGRAAGRAWFRGVNPEVGLRADIFIGPVIGHDLVKRANVEDAIQARKAELARQTGLNPETEITARTEKDPRYGRVRVTFYKIDPTYAGRVIAHEIGHVTDWFPEETLKRGNILGRVASLVNYLDHNLPDVPGVTRDDLMAELKALTLWWNPFDPEAESESYVKYRFSGKELYAEAMSVLLNYPGELKNRAPIFYSTFFSLIGRKPNFQEAWNGLQDAARTGESIPNLRKRVRQGHEKGHDMLAQSLSREALTFPDALMAARVALVDQASAVNQLTTSARRRGLQVDPDQNPMFAIENAVYTNSQVQLYHDDVRRNVWAPLDAAGLTRADLNEYLQHRRIEMERGPLGIPNPYGENTESARECLDEMRRTLGPEGFKVLEDAAAALWDLRREHVIPVAIEAGLFTPQLRQKVETNPQYVYFLILDKMQRDQARGRTSRIWQQVGTLKPIAPPLEATLILDARILATANWNAAKQSTVEVLRRMGPKNVEDAKTRWTGRRRQFIESTDPKKKLLVRLEDGVPQGVYVDKWIARAFERGGRSYEFRVAARIAGAVGLPFRMIFTTLRPGFWLFNVIRDYGRAVKNLPGLGVTGYLTFWRRWAQAVPAAWRKEFGIPDADVREMMKGDMFCTWSTIGGLTSTDKAYDRQMNDLLGAEGRGEWKGLTARERLRRTRRAIASAFNVALRLGSVIEDTPKIAGYRYLLEKYPDMPGEEVAHRVRTQIGSPPFLIRGTFTPITNNLLLFSNPVAQAWRTDIERFREDPRSVGWKVFASGVMPKVLQFALASGALLALVKALGADDDEPAVKWLKWMQKAMNDIGEYGHRNYIIIPLGETPSGKTVAFWLPSEDSTRMIGGLAWTLMRAIDGDLRAPERALDYMAGQAPNFNPLLEVGAAGLQYLSGKNPYDAFRGRQVIPETEWRARGHTSHANETFLKWMSQQFGGDIVYRFRSEDPAEIKTDLERVLDAPVLNDILGRFVRVTAYGQIEAERRQVEEKESVRAAEILRVQAVVRKQRAGIALTDEEVTLLTIPRNAQYAKEYRKRLNARRSR